MEKKPKLPIGGMPHFVGGKRLSAKLPRNLWQQLRQKALAIYGERCGFCEADELKLDLHEQWAFYWVSEVTFTPETWKQHAEAEGWMLYEAKKSYYVVGDKKLHMLAQPIQEEAVLRDLITSPFPPYVDPSSGRIARIRKADEVGHRPYQVLDRLIMLCPHCHSVQNLNKIRWLAEQGKVDIEPILQHYIRVNGTSREKALEEWDEAQQLHEFNYPSVWESKPIKWKQCVRNYENDDEEVDTYTFLDEWIAQIVANGIDIINPRIFLSD